jgi:hypothetical protein
MCVYYNKVNLYYILVILKCFISWHFSFYIIMPYYSQKPQEALNLLVTEER